MPFLRNALTSLSVTALVLNFAASPSPVFADDKLRNALIGIGVGAIANQVLKGQNGGNAKAGTTSSSGSTNVKKSSGGKTNSKRTRRIQQALNDLGYDAGPVDGQMGPGTRAAMKAYQEDFGFVADADMTGPEVVALEAAAARKVAVENGTVAPGELTTAEVKAAQAYLKNLGYTNSKPDGAWGPQSQAALDAFNADNGLPPGNGLNLGDVANLHQSMHGVAFQNVQEVAFGDAPGGLDGGLGDFEFGSADAVDFSAYSLNPTPAVNSKEFTHVIEGKSSGQARFPLEDLAYATMKARPSLLEDTNVIRAWYLAKNPRVIDGQVNPARAKYDKANKLVQEDIINAYASDLVKKVTNAPEVSPDSPRPYALYFRVLPGEYVEGKGLSIGQAGLAEQRIHLPNLNTPLSISVDMTGTDYIPMSRDEAIKFLDRYKEEGKLLTKVAWGQLTRIGKDETVEEFASAETRGTIPTTFVVDRRTLHFVEKKSYFSHKAVDGTALYEWPKSNGTGQSFSNNAVAVAKEFRLPFADGHVVVRRDNNAQWHKFAFLSFLGQRPEWVKEHQNFIPVAANFLSPAQKKSFFGEKLPQAEAYARTDLRSLGQGESVAYNSYYSHIFDNEFDLQEAKAAFLSNSADAILARAPQWPLPVLQMLEINLGEYNFEENYFFLNGVQANSTVRVASLPGASNYPTIVSADRITNFPTELPMPRDEAKKLVESSSNGQNRKVYLAWWSDLDFGADGSELEAELNVNNDRHAFRPGRATLKRLALFADPGLTRLLMELNPDDHLLKPGAKMSVEALMPQQELTDVEALVANPDIVTDEELLGHAASLIGTSAYEGIAMTNYEVTNANEFDAQGLKNKTVQRLKSVGPGPVWLSGGAQLGRYDLEQKLFPVNTQNGINYSYASSGQRYRSRITFELRGANAFEPLEIDQETARAIVESNDRSVYFLVQVEPVLATANDDQFYRLSIYGKPLNIVFYRQQNRNEPAQILMTRSFADEGSDSEDAPAVSEESFAGLAEQTPFLNTHIIDLLAVKSMSEEQIETALPSLMLETWQAEQAGYDHNSSRFFGTSAQMPDAAEAALSGERFRTWFLTKADALGSEFKLAHASYGGFGQCNQFAWFQNEGFDNYEMAQGLALRNQRQIVNQAFSNAGTEKLQLSAGYAATSSRHSLQHRGRCSHGWHAVVEIRDAIVASPQRISQDGPVHRTIEVKDVKFGSLDANGMPSIFISAQSKGVEFFAPLESADAPLVSLAAFQPEDSEEVEGVSDVTWPKLDGLEVTGSENDIIGIRIGASIASAIETIEGRGVDASYETQFIPQNPRAVLGYTKLFITKGGTDLFMLSSYAPDGPVLSVSRSVLRADGALPFNQITAALLKKYGTPDFQQNEHYMGWVEGEATESIPLEYCAQVPSESAGSIGLIPVGAVSQQDQYAFQQLYYNIMQPRLHDGEWLEQRPGCRNVLQYQSQDNSRNGGGSGLSTLLVGFQAIREVEQALKAAEPQEELSIDF